MSEQRYMEKRWGKTEPQLVSCLFPRRQVDCMLPVDFKGPEWVSLTSFGWAWVGIWSSSWENKLWEPNRWTNGNSESYSEWGAHPTAFCCPVKFLIWQIWLLQWWFSYLSSYLGICWGGLGKEEGPVRADMVLIQPFPLLTSAFPPCSMPLLSRLSSESGKCFPPWAGPWLSVASLSIFFWIPGGLVGLDSHSTKLSISEVWPFDADCGL